MTERDRIPQSYWDNSRWAAEHATELHKQYENVWVAIVDQQAVASGPNPVRVREIAARKTVGYPEYTPSPTSRKGRDKVFTFEKCI